ncbi:MAG TPA: TolC family protein, partial [Burkholderiales bacterium]
MKQHWIALVVVVALSGCATTSAMLEPNVDVPAAYRADVSGATAPLTTEWWRTFDSAELAALIDQALQDSPDLAIAMERVRQAEAQVQIVGASLFPELNLGLSSTRRKVDNDNAVSTRTTDGTSATLSASYEVDVWGLNASDRRASEASLDATRFDRESVRLTTVSGVANAYFQVLSLRGRLQVARDNLAIAERVLDIVNIRARNGVVSQLDVARQNNAVLSQRAAIPPLELQERQSLAALAILTGRTPQSF